MKLKRKIFLIFSLIAIIPMCFLTTYTVYQYTEIIDTRVEDIANEQQQNISDAVSSAYTSIRQVMMLLIFASNTDSSIVKILRPYADTNTHMTDMEIYDAVSSAYTSIRQVMMLLIFASNTDSSIVKILRPYADTNTHMTDMEIYRACMKLRNANQNVFYTYDFINGVYVYTPSMNLISYETGKNGTIAQSYNPKDDEWYKSTLQLDGKMYYSTLDEHPMFESNQKSIFFSQKIIDPDTGKYLGVLLADCSPNLFNLDSVNALGDMNLITLMNTNNNSVYYTNTDSFSVQPDTSNTIYAKINHTPLELALILDYTSLRSDYTKTATLIIILSVLCVLCVLLFTLYFSNYMIQPIEKLSRQMLSPRDSSDDKRVDYSSRKDEIGTLYRQYDTMLEQLNASIKKDYQDKLIVLDAQMKSKRVDYSSRKDEIGTLYRQYDTMLEQLNASIKKDYQDKLIVLDAQMKSLEARINSHFLFNTLESINSMAEIAENSEIATMSLALGNMFRYAIKTESELVTLEQELHHVEDYVAIQSIRFDNRFQLLNHVPAELYSQRVLKLYFSLL